MRLSLYQLGARRCRHFIGVHKYAGILPPPSAMARAIGSRTGRVGTQAADNAVQAGAAARESLPGMQYIKALGPPRAGESATSQWFRGHVLQQTSPKDMLASTVAALPKKTVPKATTSPAATMRPTARP